MPQLDIYIWFINISVFLLFFFLFYFFVLYRFLIKISSYFIIKNYYINYIIFLNIFIIKYNYFVDFGLFNLNLLKLLKLNLNFLFIYFKLLNNFYLYNSYIEKIIFNEEFYEILQDFDFLFVQNNLLKNV